MVVVFLEISFKLIVVLVISLPFVITSSGWLSLLLCLLRFAVIGSRFSREKLKLDFQGGLERRKFNLAGLTTRQPTQLQSNM